MHKELKDIMKKRSNKMPLNQTRSYRSRLKGFTLIESLVYIALLVVILVGIVNAVVLLSSSYRNVKTARSIETSAISAMDRIVRETRDATSINVAQSVFGSTTSPVLSLNSLDASGTPMTVKFSVANARIMLEENGVNLGPLTTIDTAVQALTFRSYSTTTSSAVKIEMTISSASTSAVYFSRNFYGTSVLRGSY